MAEFLPGKVSYVPHTLLGVKPCTDKTQTVGQIFHFVRTQGAELLPQTGTPNLSMGPPPTTRTYRPSEISNSSALHYDSYRYAGVIKYLELYLWSLCLVIARNLGKL